MFCDGTEGLECRLCVVFTVLSSSRPAATYGLEVVAFVAVLALMSVCWTFSCSDLWQRTVAMTPFTTIMARFMGV